MENEYGSHRFAGRVTVCARALGVALAHQDYDTQLGGKSRPVATVGEDMRWSPAEFGRTSPLHLGVEYLRKAWQYLHPFPQEASFTPMCSWLGSGRKCQSGGNMQNPVPTDSLRVTNEPWSLIIERMVTNGITIAETECLGEPGRPAVG